jgi:hypothetical protein
MRGTENICPNIKFTRTDLLHKTEFLILGVGHVSGIKFTQKDIAWASFAVKQPRVSQQKPMSIPAAAGKILISGATDVDNWSLSRA